ncbi:deoxyhypusine hydroxylase [Saxophila tyrrhenica]|uniref:Deoxyhypusine hydroxylase n=1 Tax=Saxophila tyrrhenica TaxID=1690608 RepID=A0AAV9NYB3_9PEZI|nr:deoxyhypusine hydroxylase [Saxophila tyrrhenica]
MAADNQVKPLRDTLTNESAALAARFRALFSLKHLASQQPATSQTIPAIEAIAAAFTSPSALLKHELAYCLGQSGNEAAIPHLRAVIEDRQEDAMCRHEAAEALGALGDSGSLGLLKERWQDKDEEEVVRETCEIAVARIEWANSKGRTVEELKQSDFASIDPAPPLPLQQSQPSIPDLQQTLLDTSLKLFQRYRAMFALRDLASPPDLPTAKPAILALAQGFKDPSALFRHEIAFVFGQLSHPASIPSLVETLSDTKEASMVRHEAAEALGSLGEEEGVEDVLKKFLNDPEQVVRESIVVALDMADFERSGGMEGFGVGDDDLGGGVFVGCAADVAEEVGGAASVGFEEVAAGGAEDEGADCCHFVGLVIAIWKIK